MVCPKSIEHFHVLVENCWYVKRFLSGNALHGRSMAQDNDLQADASGADSDSFLTSPAHLRYLHERQGTLYPCVPIYTSARRKLFETKVEEHIIIKRDGVRAIRNYQVFTKLLNSHAQGSANEIY